jgi:hypothetical protein
MDVRIVGHHGDGAGDASRLVVAAGLAVDAI